LSENLTIGLEQFLGIPGIIVVLSASAWTHVEITATTATTATSSTTTSALGINIFEAHCAQYRAHKHDHKPS
jgi:hypothetical protein